MPTNVGRPNTPPTRRRFHRYRYLYIATILVVVGTVTWFASRPGRHAEVLGSRQARTRVEAVEKIAQPRAGISGDARAAMRRYWTQAAQHPPAPALLTLPVPEPVPADENQESDYPDIGRIQIPAIGLSTVLHEGVSLVSIDRGPALWPGTARPGQFGNMVIAGHRVSHSRPFHDLDRLKPGDDVFITDVHTGDFRYQVTGTEIVAPDQLSIISQAIAYEGTLFACHPIGSAKYRIVVHLHLVDILGNPVRVPPYKVVHT